MKKRIKTHSVLLLFFISSIVVLVVSVSASRMMLSAAQMIEESTSREMTALSEAAALLVTAEALDAFQTPQDMETPAYQALREKLDAFTQRAGVLYTYYMRLDPGTNQMRFIIDNVTDPSLAPDDLSSPPVAREPGPDLALTGVAHTESLGNYSIGWDGLLTAWAPIYYSDGSLSNMVAGVDMIDVNIRMARRNTYMLSIVLLAAMAIVLTSCITSLLLYQRKADQSKMASEAKSSFLSRMSHEMRTPMNAIIGLSRMAQASNDPNEVRGYVSNIEVASEHLRLVIDDVLDISRIESGKMTLTFTPVDIREEMARLERIIRPQAESKGLTFTVHIAPGVPQMVYYDTTHTQQVLVNLLANAVKFTPQGGSVQLRVMLLALSGERCRLVWRVEDTGVGISEENRARIFAPFEQGDVSNTRQFGGSGLGLAIVQKLVSMMDGSIDVESAPGKGSVFTLTLWLRLATQADLETADPVKREKALDLAGKRVLLVEDSDMNRMIAVNLFETLGAQVDEAVNGQEGVARFIDNPSRYDLVLMDIQMPVMDGYDATRAIRAHGDDGARVPIIAMTANVFKEDVDKALTAGMDGHVGKPFDMDQIEAVIRKTLDSGKSAGLPA